MPSVIRLMASAVLLAQGKSRLLIDNVIGGLIEVVVCAQTRVCEVTRQPLYSPKLRRGREMLRTGT